MGRSLVRYFGMVRIAVRGQLQYRFNFLMTLLAVVIYSLLYYMLWRAIYHYSPRQVLAWQQLITYVLVGQVISFARFSPAERAPVYGVASRIRSGDVALDLIRPVDFQLQRFWEASGFYLVELVWVNIPAFLIFIFVLRISSPRDALTWLSFLLSLWIGFIVAFGLNSIVMMLSFWTGNAQGIQKAKKAVVEIMAGTLIPYEFFPPWLRTAATHLPFQSMAYVPLSIYTGKLSGSHVPVALGTQLLWAMVMLVLSRLIWRRAFQRLTIYGG